MFDFEICDIFDKAFDEVTKKLIRIELKRAHHIDERKMLEDMQRGYWELIQTKGYVNAKIVCYFSNELFRYITDTMNGGISPPEEEVYLYLNEYINIICGYALSQINNLVKKTSRLSVPSFNKGIDSLETVLDMNQSEFLLYNSSMGSLYVYICYSVDEQQKEGE